MLAFWFWIRYEWIWIFLFSDGGLLVPGRASHGGGSIHWQRESAGAVGDGECGGGGDGVSLSTVGNGSRIGAEGSQGGDDSGSIGY